MKDKDVHSLLIVLVLLVLAIQVVMLLKTPTTIIYQANNTTTTPGNLGYLTISATGTASEPPTVGTLYLNVQGRGLSAAAATANLSSALIQMNTSLSKYINGNLSMIKTTYYNLYNETGSNYYYPVVGVATPVYPASYASYNGFVAVEQITVTIPNVQNVSNAIGALSSSNSIEITSASSTLSDAQTSALRTEAFANAMQNATSQAGILTGNASLSVQNITVNYYNFYPIPYALGSAPSAGISSSTATNPQFYSGTDSITESITIVFSYSKK